ncbi:glycoside hydrolase family 1 protein [Lactococcus cremoris]|uniref:glycoside hydrolase family 1 protein n=1 Tax=Lactococcus lactis subsp. cremoris TaxID=1359 RepID=UPI0007AEABD9|nr:glycoside hydrolase family 1 protein [Lactococcus cremoris]KZK33733.1 6-phospho-beta-glucosidase [Lactococcus cremoris]MCT0502581.1 glycoside hydrolase family 1 protein [Lactococcus cremoris]MCT0504756.1 glycoside hydrolase family 1 protein [Lactococcus cremoris]
MFFDEKGFKKDFKWGSSTNAQQFEGGHGQGGKGVSIADVRVIPGADKESNFNEFKIASDHYHHMKEDIKLYAEMGFEIYRFTIAWTRIFPNGDEIEANPEGIAFYSAMLDELDKYNIEPVATLYAYDLPLNLLEKYRGFMSREIIKDFTHYAETVIKAFKGRIKYWIPFNEQNFIDLDSEYMTGYKAKNRAEVFQLQHHFNLCYAKTTNLVHEIDPAAKVGGNLGNVCLYPLNCDPVNVEATDELAYKSGYGFADVLFRGVYSGIFIKSYEGTDFSSIVLDDDLEVLKSASPDFMALCYYLSAAIEANSFEDRALNGVITKNPYIDATEWKWPIDPYGFKHYLHDYYHRYQLPILITENGMGARDTLKEDGTVNDDYRIKYLADHIARMKEAVEEGVEMIGYLTWSATDLYSTREGFEKRYGFVYIDKDYKRIKKRGFDWYKKVISTNGEDLSY